VAPGFFFTTLGVRECTSWHRNRRCGKNKHDYFLRVDPNRHKYLVALAAGRKKQPVTSKKQYRIYTPIPLSIFLGRNKKRVQKIITQQHRSGGGFFGAKKHTLAKKQKRGEEACIKLCYYCTNHSALHIRPYQSSIFAGSRPFCLRSTRETQKIALSIRVRTEKNKQRHTRLAGGAGHILVLVAGTAPAISTTASRHPSITTISAYGFDAFLPNRGALSHTVALLCNIT